MAQVLENAHGALYTLPRGVFITGLDRPQAVTLIGGGLGAVVTRRRLEPARGALEGSFKGRTYFEAQADLNLLLAFLHAQPLKLRLHGPSDRYLVVHAEGLSDVDSRQGRLTQFRVPLVAPDPLWVGINASNGPRTISGASTYDVTNAGNAPTPVILTITAANASRPKVENLTTGQEAELLLSVVTGNTWVLNGRLHGVERNGTPSNDAAGNAFLVGGFDLAPGVNEIRASRQAGSYSLKLDWVTRWY